MKKRGNRILEENEQLIEKTEKCVYDLYINCDGSVEDMRIIANSLGMNLKKFISLASAYAKKNIPKTNYAIILDKLSLIDDEESIINYLSQINLPISFIENNLLSYAINYRPEFFLQEEYNHLVILRRKISIYKQSLTGKDRNKKINLSPLDLAIETISKFISSNFSIERFCTQNRMYISTFNQFVSFIKKQFENSDITPNLYDIYINNLNFKIESMKNNIQDDIHKIFNLIKELGSNFCSIDLFMNTSYGVSEILEYSKTILNKEEQILFRRHISPYKFIKPFNEIKIENLFKEKLVINVNNQLIEVSTVDKAEIINFLQENDIPIFNDSFISACHRYYEGKLFANKHR